MKSLPSGRKTSKVDKNKTKSPKTKEVYNQILIKEVLVLIILMRKIHLIASTTRETKIINHMIKIKTKKENMKDIGKEKEREKVKNIGTEIEIETEMKQQTNY